ncbi:MAG: hypothetical protein K2G24_10105 [Muribaculaceae bacterium]|nr:hypothetical protein [Muribaculaceae bacterium]
MIQNLQIFGTTDNRIRQNGSGDSFAAQYIDDESRVLCMVINGTGLYENGETAADTARAAIISYLEENRDGSVRNRLAAAMTSVNSHMARHNASRPASQHTRCGVTAAIISNSDATVTIAHTGNNGMFCLSDGKLAKLTGCELDKSGNNSIGISEFRIERDCVLMLCSNDICTNADPEMISDQLSRFDDELADIALTLIENGGSDVSRDNSTVVLARIKAAPKSIKNDIRETQYDHEDPLADVHGNPSVSGRIFSAKNIAIGLTAIIIAFFAGYFAAFTLAHRKFVDASAELAVCRDNISAATQEISALKDSIDSMQNALDSMRSVAQQAPVEE